MLLGKKSARNNLIEYREDISEKIHFNVIGIENTVYIADSVKINNSINIIIRGFHNKIYIDDGVYIGNLSINISASNCSITIGKKSTFEDTFITLGDNNSFVKIGEDCMFAMQSGILASDFHPIIDNTTHKRINSTAMNKGVTLSDHVWVGLGALILKNVTIGSGSVIGTKSVVTKNISDNSIVVGNPAKEIRNNINWQRMGYFMDETPIVDMDIADYIADKDVKMYLESFDAYGCLRGWAFISGMESCEQEIFIEVKSDNKSTIYQASVFFRGDVAEAFNDEKYINSGFECIIECLENIQEINLLIVNGQVKRIKSLKWKEARI